MASNYINFLRMGMSYPENPMYREASKNVAQEIKRVGYRIKPNRPTLLEKALGLDPDPLVKRLMSPLNKIVKKTIYAPDRALKNLVDKIDYLKSEKAETEVETSFNLNGQQKETYTLGQVVKYALELIEISKSRIPKVAEAIREGDESKKPASLERVLQSNNNFYDQPKEPINLGSSAYKPRSKKGNHLLLDISKGSINATRFVYRCAVGIPYGLFSGLYWAATAPRKAIYKNLLKERRKHPQLKELPYLERKGPSPKRKKWKKRSRKTEFDRMIMKGDTRNPLLKLKRKIGSNIRDNIRYASIQGKIAYQRELLRDKENGITLDDLLPQKGIRKETWDAMITKAGREVPSIFNPTYFINKIFFRRGYNLEAKNSEQFVEEVNERKNEEQEREEQIKFEQRYWVTITENNNIYKQVNKNKNFFEWASKNKGKFYEWRGALHSSKAPVNLPKEFFLDNAS